MKYKCTREIQNLWMLILRYIQLQIMHYINNIELYEIMCNLDQIISCQQAIDIITDFEREELISYIKLGHLHSRLIFQEQL